MNIIRVISTMDPNGGGPMEAARKIDAEIIRMGHRVDTVCLDAPNADFIDFYPGKVYAIGPVKGGYAYSSKLVEWLIGNAGRYDVVVVDGLWQYHSFAVWRAFSGSSTPYFVFTHGMLDPWFKHTYPVKHLKKWLYWPWAEFRVLRDAAAVIFTCEEERLLARKSFWLYKVNEAITAFGTAEPPGDEKGLKEVFLKKFPHLRNKRILLFLSRINEKKGCDLLLSAFSQVVAQDETLHLVMAGPNQSGWQSTLIEQAVKLGISKSITWTGMLQGDLKWGAFYASEIFCLPSHQENFGIVVAEALACGKPVLISNKVNIWREIKSSAAGFVDDDTVEGTVRNLQRWLSLSENAYFEMTRNAKACFSDNFNITRAALRLLDIIQEHKYR